MKREPPHGRQREHAPKGNPTASAVGGGQLFGCGAGALASTVLVMALPWGVPLTVEDLRGMPDDGHRYELVDGVLLVTPAPGTAHQICVAMLVAALVSAAPSEHLVLPAPYDWVVDPRTSFQPDLLVARRTDVGEDRLERPPLLVVEVHSPSTRLTDLTLKRAAYEAAGVPAYWLVDPTEPSLTILRLEENSYVEEAKVVGTERYEANWPFAVSLVPALLLGRP